MFGHWRFLLAGALPLAGEEAPGSEGRWHQIIDERMPSMATLSLTPVQDGKPVWEVLGRDGRKEAHNLAMAVFEAVRDGDHMRLCFADDKGADAYPYDREFLVDDQRFWSKNAYTRFRSLGTLYLFSGYAFVAIGAGYDFDKHLIGHVRRHYFQMGLLAHFELASLLAFSSQISRAVGCLDDHKDQATFQTEMSSIEEQFLQFVHRFRFTGVSNQIQAQEMLARWRELLRLQEVFDDVQNEVHTANQFLMSRTQTRTSFAATTLALVATMGVVLGLAFSVLGMNIIFTDQRFGGLGFWTELATALVIVGVFMLLGGGMLWALTPRENVASREPRGSRLRSWPERSRLGERVKYWLQDIRCNEFSSGWRPLVFLLFGLGGFLVVLVAPLFAIIGCLAR